eukprot:scaffold12172_cov78-Skeletonema_dohrnii-CCMP3373.AAC.1
MKLSVIITTLIYASSAAAYETRIIPRHESNPNPEPELEDEDGQLGLGRHPYPYPYPTVRAMPQMLAMERDVAPVAHIVPNHVPRLRGTKTKHIMSSDAVLDYSHESLASLAKKAKNQVLRAAQVAHSLGEDAADEAEEVFESVLSIHHVSRPSTEQAFYYSSKKAVQQSNHAAHKAEQKTHRATSKAEHKTQKALNKADRKTETDALDNAAELTANAISIGTAETVDAAKLAAYEASNAVMVANDSLNDAAKVVMSALNW